MIFVENLLGRMPAEWRMGLAQADPLGQLSERPEALAEQLTDKERAQALADILGVWAKETLRIALHTFAALPFDLESLERAAETNGMPGAGLMAGLAELVRSGIVFVFRKSWGEKLYLLPADVVWYWQELLPVEQAEPPVREAPSSSSIRLVRRAERDSADRLFDLLVCVAQTSPSLTKKGVPGKKQLDALRSTVAGNRTAPSFALPGLEQHRPDGYPPELSLWLLFGLRLGLLEERDGRLAVGPVPRLSAWLGCSRASQNIRLQRIWAQLYTPTDAGECLRLTRFLRGDASNWLPQAEADRPAGVWALLAELGWLEEGEDERSSRYARWRCGDWSNGDVREHRPALYVQPDMELLAPPEVPLTVKWELERFAERVRADTVTVYRLTRQSVLGALEGGRSIDRFLDMLEREARHGIPEPVRIALQEWANAFGKVTIETVTLLRCRDAETADRIEADRRLSGYLGPRWGATDFPVLSGDTENFILLLGESGYPLRFSGGCASPGTCFPELKADESAVDFHPETAGYTAFLYEFDSFPARDNEIPAELGQSLPSIWIRELRSYRGSTRKQIIEAAIAAKAMLRLAANGQDRLIAPKRIREEGSSWTLEAFERAGAVRLEPGDWDEMQLIVPGIHDLYYS